MWSSGRMLIEAILAVVLLWRYPRLIKRYGRRFRWELKNPLKRRLTAGARRILLYLPARARAAFGGRASRALSRTMIVSLWLFRPALAATVWADRNPIYAAVLVLLWLLVFGVVGRDFGIQDLFWHETPATQILAAVSVGLLVYLVILFSECSRTGRDLRQVAARFHVVLIVPGAVVAAQAAVWIASEVWDGRASSAFANMGLPFGLLLTLGFAAAVAPRAAGYLNPWVRIILRLPVLVAFAVVMVVPTAAFWICTALAGVALMGLLLRWHPLIRLIVVLLAIAWVGYSNGQRPWKLTYPGLESLTAPGAQRDLIPLSQGKGGVAEGGMAGTRRERTTRTTAIRRP